MMVNISRGSNDNGDVRLFSHTLTSPDVPYVAYEQKRAFKLLIEEIVYDREDELDILYK